MPQLVPFYFVNQLVTGFAALALLVALMSQFLLPRILFIFLARIFVAKL